MKQDERHHTSDDIFVGIDLATRQHHGVAQPTRLLPVCLPYDYHKILFGII